MPLDMSIYSRVAQPDLTNALQSIAQIPQQRAQNRLLQMQMQAAQQSQLATEKQVSRQEGINSSWVIDDKGSPDFDATMRNLATKGYGDQISAVQKLKNDYLAQQQQAGKIGIETEKAALENHMARIKAIGQLAGSATDQASYNNALTQAKALGIDTAGMPQQYDPAIIGQLRNQALTVSEQLDNHWKQKGYDQKERDMQTSAELKRQEIAATQANQAQNLSMKRQELEIAKTKAANEQADRAQTKQGAVASYDTAIDSLNRLKSHPGMSAAVGAPNPLQGGLGFATIRGTPAADFEAELETFKSQTFLPMVQNLKGMGALSDAEGKKLSAAVGALDPRMGEGSFQASIDRIMSDLTSARARAASTAPAAPAPAASGGIPADIQALLSKHGGK